MVCVGVTDGVLDLVNGGKNRATAVDDEDLPIGHVNQLGHSTTFKHVFDLPALCDAFFC